MAFPQLQEAEIRRHTIPRLQPDDVAGRQFHGIDRALLPISQCHRLRRQHRTHCVERPLGLPLLNEADQRVDQHHTDDDAEIDPMAQHRGDRPRDQQDIDLHVLEMQQEAAQGALPWRGRQLMRTVPILPRICLVATQPTEQRFKRHQHLVTIEGMPILFAHENHPVGTSDCRKSSGVHARPDDWEYPVPVRFRLAGTRASFCNSLIERRRK